MVNKAILKEFFLLLLKVIIIVVFLNNYVYAQDNKSQKKYTLSGYIYEKGSKESLIGVNVFFPQLSTGTVSNTYGFYSITLPEGVYDVQFSFVGYQTNKQSINLNKNIDLTVEIDPIINLSEVVVTGERIEKISETPQMSRVDIPIAQIKSIPAFMGEKDVFKVLQLMPGVQKGSEGSSGLYIRGGGPDQNLIILDDATVYNASHLFGFFSVFNGDALKSVELIKGGFPARYGGRISSVLNLNMKDGNKERLRWDAGIGIISSRLLVEAPIQKGKSSFIISGRRTYLDIIGNGLARLFKKAQGNSLGYYFYDLNSKINYEFNKKNRLFLSGYFGRDKFYFSNKDENDNKMQAGLFWQNSTATVRWNHLFNQKLFSNTSFIFSDYLLKIYSKDTYNSETFSLDYSSGIRDFGVKYDFDFLPLPTHTIKFGLISNYHTFTPSAIVIKDNQNLNFKSNIKKIEAVESGIYVEDEMKILSKTIANIGFRMSSFSLVNSISRIKPEPRISVAYKIKENTSLKGSYAIMNQYIHLLSNTNVGLPTDLWVPSTRNILPQTSQQFAFGFAKDLRKPKIEISIEGYYKKSDRILGYREGASFLLINDPTNAESISWERNVTNGQAWAYGLEFLTQKKYGKFTGWIGYTLSWVQVQFDEINFGKKYFAKYDRRHDISLVGIYELKENINLSATWVFATGNALTMPIGRYEKVIPNQLPQQNFYNLEKVSFLSMFETTDYGERNSFRMAPYHRMDIGIQFKKELNWAIRTWELSVYNAYNRKNPFYYYTDYSIKNNSTVLKQISLFPIIPSISYSLKF